MDTLVVIPTHNEAKKVRFFLADLLKETKAEFLVVDSGSTDETVALIEALQKEYLQLHLLKKQKSLGKSKAILAGFEWGLEKKYEFFVGMELCVSNPTHTLNELLTHLRKYDFVIGSRNFSETNLRRRLTRVGNWYAQNLLSLPIEDLTSSFNGWQKKVFDSLPLADLQSKHSFQLELKAKAYQKGFRCLEIPISLEPQPFVKKKMENLGLLETAYRVVQLRLSN